jgi:pilus assembly protein Flp/PilA
MLKYRKQGTVMQDLIKRFLSDEEGATMVEYALMVALIAVVSIAVVAALGTGVWNAFDETNTQIQTTGGTPRAPTTPGV